MKLGVVQQLFLENDMNQIEVIFPHTTNIDKKYVTSASFDTASRSKIFLYVTRQPSPRSNHTKSIKSYILDFKQSHNVYIYDLDTDNIYSISPEYMIKEDILSLGILE